ncbi:MAG: hypothetical protein AAGF97_16760, partial [Planctomycetota bacterium]
AAWSAGDFDVNGVVDGTDFIWWNFFKFNSSFAARAVPEPRFSIGVIGAGLLLCAGRIRRRENG